MSPILRAVLLGALAALPLVLGAWMALGGHLSNRVVGLIAAFGAGALISAVAFELVLDAFEHRGPAGIAPPLALGAIVYFLGSEHLERRRQTGRSGTRGLALLMGAMLDGIPESLILGLSIAERVTAGRPDGCWNVLLDFRLISPLSQLAPRITKSVMQAGSAPRRMKMPCYFRGK